MEIIEKQLTEIRPYQNNPRINDGAVDFVANSIREFGWKQPIVIDRNGVIVACHTRYKAALQLGLKTAPCVLADDLTDEQVKAYRLADNKTAEAAEWDIESLAKELEEINLDMEQFGFEGDLDLEDDDDEPDATENPTLALPESRVFVFAVSAFGVNSEIFIEVQLTQEEADKLLERSKDLTAKDIGDKLREALNAL